MSRRKPNNMRARMERAAGGLLRQHHACIVDASVPEVQVMLNYNNLGQIISRTVANALCDFAHHWTVYISAICQNGPERWAKSVEYELAGIHVITKLPDLFEQPVQDVIASCNPKHVIGHAWIAVPDSITIDEQHAHRIYERVSAWGIPQRASA
ncbi:hypothetical protein H3221_013575 [Pseudomonas sp. LMG 31766]|uniref:Uncharacterized protein n=1 Tax=Pseudomonas chaetocerotis TaxID=2758695 RepID=A0A931D3U0_9PSED|nr:hypothetical protein [Pseudomonas chaetocerotis]MBZ9665782.1 hypothetical protein [Pseudomonas chaetocerotis]